MGKTERGEGRVIKPENWEDISNLFQLTWCSSDHGKTTTIYRCQQKIIARYPDKFKPCKRQNFDSLFLLLITLSIMD